MKCLRQLRTVARGPVRGRPFRRNRLAHRRLRHEPLEERLPLALVVWDGGGDGVSWGDAANWDVNGVDQLPANGDDVAIEVPGLSPEIQYSNTQLVLSSLIAHENLTIQSGSLTIEGLGQFQASLSVATATFTADGPTASITAAHVVSIDGARLQALNGGSLTLPAVSFSGNSGSDSRFTANGTGSTINLPELSVLSGGQFIRTHYIEATDGGAIDLSGLTQITGGATQIVATGASSQIDLSSLTTFVDTNGNRGSLLEERSGGSILARNLVSLSAVTLKLNSQSTISTSQMVSLTDGEINVQGIAADFAALTNILNSTVIIAGGGTANLPQVASFHGSSLDVSGGVTLNLPNVVSYAGQSNPNTRFKASGAGTQLSLPNLTTISGGSFISTFFVQAHDGATLDLSAVHTITGGATQVVADGVDSQIDFSALTSFTDDNGNRASIIDENNGGSILAPELTTITAATLILDSDSSMDTSQITSVLEGAIHVHTINANLNALTNLTNSELKLSAGATTNIDQINSIQGASLIVEDGVTLVVPNVTSYASRSRDTTYFRARGAGSRLSFPHLTEMTGATFIGTHRVEALEGGIVDLSHVQSIPGELSAIVADGAGSVVDLSDTVSVNLGGGRQASLTANDGGLVRLANDLVDVNRLTVTLTTTGTIEAGILQLGTLAELRGNGTLTANVINSGKLFPGNGPGFQSIAGWFQQTSAGRIYVELAGLVPVSEFDQLMIQGDAMLDGTLDVSLINGFQPGEREEFDVINFGSVSGQFANLSGRSLTSGLVWDPGFSANAFSLTALPEMTIDDVTVLEGDAGSFQAVFEVHLSTSVSYDLFVNYHTVDDFAVAGKDYLAVADTLLVPAGSDSAQVSVPIIGDLGLERDERFFVVLENPVDVALGDTVASGTILNDDLVPAIEIADITELEPAIGARRFQLEVTLSAPAPDPVQVTYATSDQTATSGSDYESTSGSLSFKAASTRGLVSDGSLGEFHPTSNVTLPLPADGILNYSSVYIPPGVTVRFTRNAGNTPVILLSQGDILVEGTILVSANGRLGGPGGGDGGVKGVGIDVQGPGETGDGPSPGTGGGAMQDFVGSAGGAGGLATDGLNPVRWIGPLPGSGGSAVSFPEAICDRGGSGGGGGGGWFKFTALSGGDGGGGGGGIVAASSHGSILVHGAIRANGANGGTSFANAFGWGGPGGGGSGGIIDLQADSISISGILEATGGAGGGISTVPSNDPNFSSGADGGLGFIRLTTADLSVSGQIHGELISRDFDTRKLISVNVLADAPGEPDETFLVNLSAAVNALFGDDQAVATIIDSVAQPGDYNANGQFEVADLDALIAAIAAADAASEFDLTADGFVDLADRDAWLAIAGAANLPSGNSYLVADANLDGVVDGIDFITWNSHKFSESAAWSVGDFNADGFVDGQDFILWNANKFTSAFRAEPHGAELGQSTYLVCLSTIGDLRDDSKELAATKFRTDIFGMTANGWDPLNLGREVVRAGFFFSHDPALCVTPRNAG